MCEMAQPPAAGRSTGLRGSPHLSCTSAGPQPHSLALETGLPSLSGAWSVSPDILFLSVLLTETTLPPDGFHVCVARLHNVEVKFSSLRLYVDPMGVVFPRGSVAGVRPSAVSELSCASEGVETSALGFWNLDVSQGLSAVSLL